MYGMIVVVRMEWWVVRWIVLLWLVCLDMDMVLDDILNDCSVVLFCGRIGCDMVIGSCFPTFSFLIINIVLQSLWCCRA